MKKVLFFFDAPKYPLLSWFIICIIYSILRVFKLNNSLILSIVIQLIAFDCFEIYFLNRIREKVVKNLTKEYGQSADDAIILDEAFARYRRTLSYLWVILLAIVVTFCLTFTISILLESIFANK